jgi:hypothetical protein
MSDAEQVLALVRRLRSLIHAKYPSGSSSSNSTTSASAVIDIGVVMLCLVSDTFEAPSSSGCTSTVVANVQFEALSFICEYFQLPNDVKLSLLERYQFAVPEGNEGNDSAMMDVEQRRGASQIAELIIAGMRCSSSTSTVRRIGEEDEDGDPSVIIDRLRDALSLVHDAAISSSAITSEHSSCRSKRQTTVNIGGYLMPTSKTPSASASPNPLIRTKTAENNVKLLAQALLTTRYLHSLHHVMNCPDSRH